MIKASSLVKILFWPAINYFSVIAGINGSGKTKLLEYIDKSGKYTKDHIVRYIDVDYRPPSQKHANEIKEQYRFRIENIDGKYQSFDKNSNNMNDWTTNKISFKNHKILETLDYAIIDAIIEERKKFQNNPTVLRKELDRIEAYKESFNINYLLPADKKDDQPWDRIDRILNAFGLLIRVDRMNLVAGLEFLRSTSTSTSEASLEMKQLSSGEKVAFALALWTWGNSKGQKTDILLVDEFDAHLNPSIAEKFIDVIKEYFVDLNVQVIMTTHSHSTVVYANRAGADIIWMEDNLIDSEITYENIIRELSNGLIDINYLTEEMHLLIENRERCVIYTEGKTDRKHIENAIEVLGRQDEFANYFIFGCTGADSVPFFVGLKTGQSKRIALLDRDTKGKEVYQRILDNAELRDKIDKGKLKVLFVSQEDNTEIENLFEDSLRTVKHKEKFAIHMSQPRNKTAENYTGFSNLLNELLRLLPAR